MKKTDDPQPQFARLPNGETLDSPPRDLSSVIRDLPIL